MGGTEAVDIVQRQVPPSGYDSVSQTYVWRIALTPILVNTVGSNQVKNKVLTVIDVGVPSEAGFDSTRWVGRRRWALTSIYTTALFVTTVDLEEAELDEALDLNAAEETPTKYLSPHEKKMMVRTSTN